MRVPILLSLSLFLAGCASPNGGHADILDTGDIEPGAEKVLTFGSTSVEMHCHPHPFMLHNVTVAAGGAGTMHVHILDGSDTSEYRFEPPNITIAPDSTVTYHNHGNMTHTATQAADGAMRH